MKHLYIHIGTGKTGSTAIQSFLYKNCERLRYVGLNYADSGRGNIQHHPLCLNHPTARTSHGGHPTAGFLDAWERLRDEVDESQVSKHVISSEYFPGITPMEVARISEMMADVASVHMMAYFRRQDLYLESWYAQLVKTGRTGSDLGQLRKRLTARGTLNFYHHSVKWAGIVGDECVHVRPYERNAFKSRDLLADFFDTLGIDLPSDLTEPSEEGSNPSLTRPQVEIIKALNDLGVAEALGKRLTRPHPLFSGLDKSFLSTGARLALLEEFAESNAQVARRFLGREDGRLFEDTTVDYPRTDPNPETVLTFLREVLDGNSGLSLVKPSGGSEDQR